MSAHSNSLPGADTGSHGSHEQDHGTMKSYVTGFVLAVILTAIPFWLVLGNVFAKSSTTGLVLMGLAVVQIVVHMVYFLHMNTKSEGGWSILALIFTTMLVMIMLSGSIWVMYHLNHNMMPGMMNDTAIEAVPESMHNMHDTHNMPGMKGMNDMQPMPKTP